MGFSFQPSNLPYTRFLKEIENTSFDSSLKSSSTVRPSVPPSKTGGQVITSNLLDPNRIIKSAALGSPLEARRGENKAVINKPAWKTFTDKFNSLGTLWNRKLIARGLALISGGFAITGGYLAYMFMAQRAAAAALTKAAVPGVNPVSPNLRTLRYAGAATLLANSLTIVEALPQTVFAIVNIVSTIKTGVKIRREIVETQKKLTTLAADPNKTTEKELELKEMLATKKTELASLPAKGFIAGATGVMSTLSLARGSMGVAMVALFATTQGKMATIATLMHVGSILGTVTGAIGVCLGGAAVALGSRQAYKTYQEIGVLSSKIQKLEASKSDVDSAGKTKLIELEIQLLNNQKLALKDQLKHTLITTASNLMLTFAGVAGLLGAAGIVTGPGALVFGGIALVFVGISASISTAHYFYRKQTDKALAENQQKNQIGPSDMDAAIQEMTKDIKGFSDDDISVLLPSWSTPKEHKEMIAKFREEPEIFLRKHFMPLSLTETKKIE